MQTADENSRQIADGKYQTYISRVQIWNARQQMKIAENSNKTAEKSQLKMAGMQQMKIAEYSRKFTC